MFKDLREVEFRANKLIHEEYGFNAPDGFEIIVPTVDLDYHFEWMNSKKALGQCDYRKGAIRLSKPIVKANLDREEKIEDTILHEIAHAISGEVYGRNKIRRKAWKGHGKGWKSIARQVGARPRRCFDPASEGLKMPKGKYTAFCPNWQKCGTKVEYHRAPKGLLKCARCRNRVIIEQNH